MNGADLYTIETSGYTITDQYGSGNERPVSDSVDSVTVSSNDNGDTYRFQIVRFFDTGDPNSSQDQVLVEDGEHNILWAYGDYDGGLQQYHGDNRGSKSITLCFEDCDYGAILSSVALIMFYLF